MFICKFCGQEKKSKKSLVQHEIRCTENINRIPCGPPKGHAGYNQYTKAKRLGLPKPEKSQATKEKLSKAAKGRTHSLESKQACKKE